MVKLYGKTGAGAPLGFDPVKFWFDWVKIYFHQVKIKFDRRKIQENPVKISLISAFGIESLKETRGEWQRWHPDAKRVEGKMRSLQVSVFVGSPISL